MTDEWKWTGDLMIFSYNEESNKGKIWFKNYWKDHNGSIGECDKLII